MDCLFLILSILFIFTIVLFDSSNGLRCRVQIGPTRRDENTFENCTTNITCGFSQNNIKLTWINPSNQRNLTRYGFYIREEKNNLVNTSVFPRFDGLKDEQDIPFKVKPFTTYDVQITLFRTRGVLHQMDTVCESNGLFQDDDTDNDIDIVIAVCSTIIILTLAVASLIFIFLLRRRSKQLSRSGHSSMTGTFTDKSGVSNKGIKPSQSRSLLGQKAFCDKNQNIDKEYDNCSTNPGHVMQSSELQTDSKQTCNEYSVSDKEQGERTMTETNSYDYCMVTKPIDVDDTYSTTQRNGDLSIQVVSTACTQKDSSENYDHVVLEQPDTYAHIVRQNIDDNDIHGDMYDQVNFK